MLEYLEQAFGDPDRAQNAQNKLFQLRQKNLDFSTYLSEFQRLALEGEMPESALSPLLFQGISRELQDMLLHNPPPSQEFSAYATHLQKLDNRYRQHQQQITRNRHTPSARTAPGSYASAARHTSSPDPPVRRTNSPRPAPPTPTTAYEPMDLSSQRELKHPFGIVMFDGDLSEQGTVTHYVKATMRVEDHTKTIRLNVTQLAHYPVILGMPWLKLHDLRVGFASYTLTFESEYCQRHCNIPRRPNKIHALHDILPKARPVDLLDRPKPLQNRDIAKVSLNACAAYARRNYRMFTVTIEQIDRYLAQPNNPELLNLEALLPAEIRDF
ncbi:hypothetical protein DDE82_008931 [Stemphylium lycopersici]|nr:hypothetical protein DDE82_008931 [Stemphylium lycopersici]